MCKCLYLQLQHYYCLPVSTYETETYIRFYGDVQRCYFQDFQNKTFDTFYSIVFYRFSHLRQCIHTLYAFRSHGRNYNYYCKIQMHKHIT